ncbi:hypothetical protein BH23GEM3_BH23GEM3_25740 [soil metagenome]|nr:hypothetical protein [Gemmatimonadota bacterium]
MHPNLSAALHGAAAGTVATLPMSVVMLAAQAAGLMGKEPPKLVAEKAFEAVGVRPSETVDNVATSVAHLGFGFVAGALFGLLRHRVELPLPPVAQGIAYGLLVYTVSYEGWIPALHIMPWPRNDRPGRQPSMVAAHIVFGAVLGALAD